MSHTYPYTTNVITWGKNCSATPTTCKGKTDKTYIPTHFELKGTTDSTECGSIYTYWEITLTAYTCEPVRAVGDTTPCPDGNNSDGDPYK